MSTASSKVFAALVAILAFGIMMTVLIESELIARVWNYWQINAVDTAYKGPNDLHATEWWGLPALIVSFLIPAIGLMIPALVGIVIYDRCEKSLAKHEPAVK